MASSAHSIPAPAQQPELRAYIVYDRLPLGHVAHTVTEATCSMLHQGEAVVLDPTDRSLATGDLFVVECGRSNPKGPSRRLAEFKRRTLCIRDDDGEFRDQPVWTAVFYGVSLDMHGRATPIRMTDGPVRASSPEYLADRIVGRVVGILAPSFAEPMRLAA